MWGTRVASVLICLLAAMLPVAAAHAAPNTRPTAPGAPAKADADRDGVFDDLESRLTTLADSDQISVIVVLRERALPDRVEQLRQASGLRVSTRFSLIDAVAGRVTKGRLRALARHPLVEHVEANSVVHALNDTAQGSFGVTAARTNAPGIEGNADGNVATYSAGDLVAAVLDSGIDAGHRDLDEGKVIAFRDFVNGLTSPYDDDGHGTHVAATLAGEGDARADLRYRGVAPGAALVGVKVLDSNGNGTFEDVISGIEWVVANKTLYGIEVINLSLGAPGCNNGTDSASQAVNAAHDAGLVVAVAAGNSGPGTCTIETPGAAAKALTVGSMADLGVNGFYQSFTSSRGRTLDGRVKPDVSAPGVNVTSATAGSATGYVIFSGTSMATPFVAGVALLMREANPALTSQAVKDKVMQTATDWGRGATNGAGTTGPDPEYGAGRLDAYAALVSAGLAIGPPPPGPAHVLREGTMSGMGAQIDYPLVVRDTRFPIAATMIIPGILGASANNPDFDIFLIDPGGAEVASSEFRTRQEEFGHLPTTTGTYTLRVRSFRGSGGFFVDVSAGLEDPGYARPKGATPVRASLVPAYQPCGSANRTHGPPLAHPSCSPPSRTSGFLTVGSPDANGQPANFVGHVRLVANPGNPSTPADEADVTFTVDAGDVRNSAGLAGYTGELEARLGLRLTDKHNGTSSTDSATTQDFSFDFTVPCSAGACAVTTSADAVTPGSVVEGKRAIWQLGQVRVFDGGPDGDVDTPSGNTLFAVQGVFVP